MIEHSVKMVPLVKNVKNDKWKLLQKVYILQKVVDINYIEQSKAGR